MRVSSPSRPYDTTASLAQGYDPEKVRYKPDEIRTIRITLVAETHVDCRRSCVRSPMRTNVSRSVTSTYQQHISSPECVAGDFASVLDVPINIMFFHSKYPKKDPENLFVVCDSYFAGYKPDTELSWCGVWTVSQALREHEPPLDSLPEDKAVILELIRSVAECRMTKKS
jgi:hypothetical protein